MRKLYIGLMIAACALQAACGGDDSGVSASSGSGGSGSSSSSSTSSTSSSSSSSTSSTSSSSSSSSEVTLSPAAQVGEKEFFDKTLSASGKMSCSTCHDPAFSYGPPNSLAVQLGGPDLQQAGFRAVPSLTYREVTPPYGDQAMNPDGITIPGPGGGLMWDGRADNLADQTQLPLLNPVEMANASQAAVVQAVQAGPYAALFKQAFGDDIFSNTTAAFSAVGKALQAYESEDPDFHPYTSKFDLKISNKIGGTLTAAETRGLNLFTDADDPDDTTDTTHNHPNCVACHYAGSNFGGSIALFTDFTYEAIVPPRNAEILDNKDPSYYDMGICGPYRTDHLPSDNPDNAQYCGLFKAPSLRNVATRTTFFHNGVMHSLNQVIHFYNTRDTNPELWYPTVGGTQVVPQDPNFPTYGLITTQYVGGTVQKFDDLPAQYAGNVDFEQPMGNRAPGSTPVMSEQDIQDIQCFLNTLTDGYKPPATAPTSGTCVD